MTSRLHHGANKDCPEVQHGDWTHCLGHPEPVPDYSIEAENVEGHIRNCLSLLDADQRHGFWERRSSVAALRKRLLAALALLEPQP